MCRRVLSCVVVYAQFERAQVEGRDRSYFRRQFFCGSFDSWNHYYHDTIIFVRCVNMYINKYQDLFVLH